MLDNFADDVRRMAVGTVVSRATRVPLARYRASETDRKGFNSYVARLRHSTGFSLTTCSTAPEVIDDHVVCCYLVTRTA